MWRVVWSVAVWVLWCHQKNIIFRQANLDLEVVFQLIRLKSWYILCDQITRHQHQPNSHFPLVQCSSTSKVGEVDFNKGQIKNRASHNRGGCMARVGWKMRIRLMLVTSDGLVTNQYTRHKQSFTLLCLWRVIGLCWCWWHKDEKGC